MLTIEQVDILQDLITAELSYCNRDDTDKTEKEKIAKLDEVSEDIKHLDTSPDTICISWCVEDVQSIAEDLTVEECREVLQAVKYKHDATIGVNWDVLEEWADEVRSKRKK